MDERILAARAHARVCERGGGCVTIRSNLGVNVEAASFCKRLGLLFGIVPGSLSIGVCVFV